jgi:hypothetical protein
VTAKQKRGPDPERLKIEGDWEDAVAKALQVPAEGKPPATKKAAKKRAKKK